MNNDFEIKVGSKVRIKKWKSLSGGKSLFPYTQLGFCYNICLTRLQVFEVLEIGDKTAGYTSMRLDKAGWQRLEDFELENIATGKDLDVYKSFVNSLEYLISDGLEKLEKLEK